MPIYGPVDTFISLTVHALAGSGLLSGILACFPISPLLPCLECVLDGLCHFAIVANNVYPPEVRSICPFSFNIV